MVERRIYTREEVIELRDAVREGCTPTCPRCRISLRAQRIPPSPDVGYVRRRVWWSCDQCGRSVVVDDRS